MGFLDTSGWVTMDAGLDRLLVLWSTWVLLSVLLRDTLPTTFPYFMPFPSQVWATALLIFNVSWASKQWKILNRFHHLAGPSSYSNVNELSPPWQLYLRRNKYRLKVLGGGGGEPTSYSKVASICMYLIHPFTTFLYAAQTANLLFLLASQRMFAENSRFNLAACPAKSSHTGGDMKDISWMVNHCFSA